MTEEPKIETPVIDIQDLEYNASPATHVNSKGVKITPRLDDGDKRDFAREDEAAIEALEEFEKQVRKQIPG
jgi:hypothetical protein